MYCTTLGRGGVHQGGHHFALGGAGQHGRRASERRRARNLGHAGRHARWGNKREKERERERFCLCIDRFFRVFFFLELCSYYGIALNRLLGLWVRMRVCMCTI